MQKNLKKIKNWQEWFISFEEEKPFFTSTRARSPVMLVIGLCFFLLRRLSLHENLKHLSSTPFATTKNKRTPARFNDYYILIFTTIYGFFIFATKFQIPKNYLNWLAFFALFNILQILQTTLYHLIWRKAVARSRHKEVYSHIRNLAITILSFLNIVWLFGLVYWWRYYDKFENCLNNAFEGIYFSMVTSSTLGYGDIIPSKVNPSIELRLIILLQVITSIVMIAVIVARAVSSIELLKENENKQTSATLIRTARNGISRRRILASKRLQINPRQ